MEQCTIEKLSAIIGVVQNGTLRYEHQQQHMTATVGTPSWYAWLETATTFRFECSEGTFTAHKVRAGNRRGGWYWRACRRQHGRLSRCYLGVSANLTLPCLHETAGRLAALSEATSTRKNVSEQKQEQELESQTMTSSAVLPPILILNTKFALPCLPVQHVSRPHLLAFVEQGVQRPLTLISAPAGSGKTTLLAEWAATTTLPVVCLSLETADNDPARFLSYLLATLARLDKRLGTAIQADRSWYAHDHEHALIGPLNDLARLLTQDAVVILDDYHLITTDAIHAALHFLLDHLPARLHLLIGTRIDPPLPLARLRARNHLSELRIEELRFVSPEVEAFARTMGLTLSREALSLLQARTEGWIAGIQLLALALRRHTDAAAFLRASGGTHRFLLDYVSEEVLAQQTAEMQRFLLRTCILEQLTGSLCDAVTEEPGGQTRLAAALRANLFVSALDDTQTWYRYHSLFAEALRARLRQLLPELVPELYRRASRWYEQQQRGEEACEYAFLAGDQPRAAALLERLIPHLLGQGKSRQIGQWLSQLSPTLVAASPTLWVASISMPMFLAGIQGTSEQTMTLLIEQIERQIQAHTQDGQSAWAELQLALPLMQAIAALTRGDFAHAIALALEVSPELARSESTLSSVITVGRQGLLGAAYGASGDLTTVEQLFFAPDVHSAVRPRNFSVAPGLSDLYETHGQLRKLGQFYDDLFQELALRTDPSPPIFSALMQARYALLLYEWNRLADAEKAVRKSMEIAGHLDTAMPLAFLVLLLNLSTQARLALAQGDRALAGHVLEDIESNVTTFQMDRQQVAEPGQRLPGVILARLALVCGQLELAVHWGETCGLRFDSSPTFQSMASGYLDSLTLVRVLFVRGRSQGNASSLSQAASLLKRLRDLALEKNWRGRLIEIEMLLALTLQAQGKTRRALTTLGSVLAQAEPEGYLRLFVDEGAPMAHLLAQIAAYTTASADYIQLLQTALAPRQHLAADPAHTVSHQLLPNPLSPREQEVLQLVARGFSNQQIADHLIISLNTAKRHVKHLLAKLVVTNRTQALARARELHLL